jgi:hypothetical protein
MATIVAIGGDARGDTKSSAVVHAGRCGRGRERASSAELQGSVITRSQIHGFSAEEQFGARWETQHDGSSHAPLPHDVTAVNFPGI